MPRRSSSVLLVFALLGTAPAVLAAPSAEVARLLETIRHGTAGARNRAAERLYYLQDPDGNSAIEQMASTAEPSERAVGLWAVAVVKPPGAAGVVSTALKDADLSVRHAAIRAAGVLCLETALPILRRYLDAENAAIRGSSIRALARLGRSGVAVLARAMRHRSTEDQLLIVEAIAERPPDAVGNGALLRATVGRYLPVRLLAAATLVRRGDRRGERTLILLAKQRRDKGMRLQAVRLLGRYGGERSLRTLWRLARDRDPLLRQAAADAIATHTAAKVQRATSVR